VPEFFVDVPFEGEIVRARSMDGTLSETCTKAAIPSSRAADAFTKEQISPTRDSRLRWMQSVVHCTHYIAGAGEKAYLRPKKRRKSLYQPRCH
jgi:hypothetical protein